MDEEELPEEWPLGGRIVNDLVEQGWSVQPDFLPPETFLQLRAELVETYEEGEFAKAAIGRADEQQVVSEVRGDYIHWLEPGSLTAPQQAYWDTMMELRHLIKRTCFLPLNNFECHFAVFPAGSFYKKHFDQFRGMERRQISCVLYLNKDWHPQDEGWLRIYGPDGKTPVADVPPLPNTFVCFRSGDVLHEVRPTRVQRYSLTGWMRSDPMPFL